MSNTSTTARKPRTRKAAVADVVIDDTVDMPDIIIPADDAVDDIIEVPADDVIVAPAASNRKYFSHANCTHARKGDAGKAARAMCRRNVRAWLAAEAEYLANLETDVAV